MKKILMILGNGFEEIEVVVPLDILRRAGLEVDTAALDPEPLVEGSHGIRIQADKRLEDCPAENYAMLLIPGGPGAAALKKDERILNLVREFKERSLYLAAICAAPAVLAAAGVTAGRTVTSFPGVRDEIASRIGTYTEARVVVDGRMITSRGAGTAEEFAFQLVDKLVGPEAVAEVRRKIVAR